MSTHAIAHRRGPEVDPQPIGRVNPERPGEAAPTVLRRVRGIREKGMGPAYLFIDAALNVYVLSDCQSCTKRWTTERFKDFVGCYSTTRVPGHPTLSPTLEGLAEDIEEHVRDMLRG